MSSLSHKRGPSGSKVRRTTPSDDSSPIGHIYLDVRRRLLYCLNDAARRMQADGVPFTSLDLVRQPLQTLQGETVRPADLPLERTWREGRPTDAIFVMTRKGGVTQHLQWTAAPLWDPSGQVLAIVGSVIVRPPDPDWHVLAGLAHDLRSPLHALKLLVNLALDAGTEEEERRELLERVRAAAEHALSVGSDVLEWCRGPAQGGRRLELIWLPLAPFLTALAQEQAVPARQKGLILVPAFDAVRGWDVLTDRVRLSRLLVNVLNNAVRYTMAGRIEFSATWRVNANLPGERQLALRVADTGTGISPEEQESIFQPFERGKAGRSDSSGGSGLGLAVVDRLVEELHLGLEVTSEHGAGSVFDLLIPETMLRPSS